MLRLFVIVMPLLVAVGATYFALRMPPTGTSEQRFVKSMIGASVVGILLSVVTLQHERSMAVQLGEARQQAATKAKGDVNQYERQISALTAQVASLQEQQTKPAPAARPADISATVKVQSPKLPKIYWTEQNQGPGEVAVRFKIYGPLNIPAFIAICENPCRATHGEIGAGSEGTELVGTTNKMAGYIFRKPRPVPAGTEGYLLLHANGKVSEFRILDESEIPDNLK